MDTQTEVYVRKITRKEAIRTYKRLPEEIKEVQTIILEVGAKYGISYTDMISQRRDRNWAWPRQEAYSRCIKETLYSLPAIAHYFGGRHHSTILKGAQKYEARLKAQEVSV